MIKFGNKKKGGLYIESKRIILREIDEGDWIDVHNYASQEIVCQYQPLGPNTEEESKAFVKQVMIDTHKNPRSRFFFAIILKEKEKMIGAVELNVHDFFHRVGEIGYILHPAYWGMGFATEASQQLLAFGFNPLNLHRIYATCDQRNSGSAKVLEKIGMTREGTIREDLLLRDGWRNSFLYSILEQEWKELI
ncbi:MAG: GNAT family N-acetyltransferase [Bacillaceae bacterium]